MKRNSSSQRREEMQGVSSSSTTLLSSSPSLTFCPSGGSTLAEIAVRVARELSLQEDGLEGYVHDAEESFFHNSEAELSHLDDEEEEEEEEEEQQQQQQQQAEDYDDRDEDFEFTFVCGVPGSSPVSADEIFHNGQIRPMYKYTSLINLGCPPRTESTREDYRKQRPRRPPLKLLMSEDDRRAGELPESEELEGAAPGTYCVWVPREALGKHCGKSSSTGSDSWRWKLKHLLLLLNRSNSDGTRDVPSDLPATGAEGHHAAVCEGAKPGAVTTESHDVGRRPYLLYRTDLVSFFTNINGLGRNLHPFR